MESVLDSDPRSNSSSLWKTRQSSARSHPGRQRPEPSNARSSSRKASPAGRSRCGERSSGGGLSSEMDGMDSVDGMDGMDGVDGADEEQGAGAAPEADDAADAGGGSPSRGYSPPVAGETPSLLSDCLWRGAGLTRRMPIRTPMRTSRMILTIRFRSMVVSPFDPPITKEQDVWLCSRRGLRSANDGARGDRYPRSPFSSSSRSGASWAGSSPVSPPGVLGGDCGDWGEVGSSPHATGGRPREARTSLTVSTPNCR